MCRVRSVTAGCSRESAERHQGPDHREHHFLTVSTSWAESFPCTSRAHLEEELERLTVRTCVLDLMSGSGSVNQRVFVERRSRSSRRSSSPMLIPWGTRVPAWPRTEPRWNGAGREGTGSRRAPDWRKFAGKLTSDLDPVNSQQRVARRITRIVRKERKEHTQLQGRAIRKERKDIVQLQGTSARCKTEMVTTAINPEKPRTQSCQT